MGDHDNFTLFASSAYEFPLDRAVLRLRATSSVIHFSAQTACPPVRRRRRGTRLCPSVRLFPNSCDRATADRRRRSRRRRRRAPPACPSPPVCLSSDRTGLHRASRRSPVEAAATTTDCAPPPAAPDRERLGVELVDDSWGRTVDNCSCGLRSHVARGKTSSTF